jgi:hypothetical protein
MPEHDLLMQLNKDIKEVCRAVGRIEEKVDNSIKADSQQCDVMETLDDRVTCLEHKDIYRTGVAGGIAIIVSGIMGWIR